jgi:hypothetical protein
MIHNLTTRLLVRVVFALLSQTAAHAEQFDGPIRTCVYFNDHKTVWFCVPEYPPKPCAPGYDHACNARDNGVAPYEGHGR